MALMLNAKELKDLPRPWLLPLDAGISFQLTVFAHKSTSFCPSVVLASGRLQNGRQLEKLSTRKKRLNRILNVFKFEM